MRDKLLTIVKIVVSLVLIIYVFSKVPLAEVRGQIFSANPLFLLLALLAFLAAIAVNALKWRVLLGAQEIRIPFPHVLRFQFIGFFFNNLLPANVGGDVMRGYGLARYTDRTAGAAVSVVVDRIMGLLGYMATAVLAAFVAVAVVGRHELEGVELAAVLALVILCLLFGLLLSRRLRASIGRIFTWAPLARLAPAYQSLSNAFDSYRFSYRALILAFIIGLFGILCTTLVNWFLSQSMGGGMSLLQILLFNPLIALVLMVPISIGGVGLSQNAYTFFYGLAGVPADHALAVSLFMQLVVILASLPGAILWLRFRRSVQDEPGPQPAPSPERQPSGY